MKHRFVLFWIVLFCTSVAQTMTDVEVDHRKQEMDEATPNPSFTWTSPFALRVVFPNGNEDDIGLQPVYMEGKPVKCLFRGQFYRDPVSSAMVSGCMADDTVTITIISKKLWGRTAFEVNKGLVEEVQNPYVSNPQFDSDDDENNGDENDRDKRSAYNYEDYVDYDYLEGVYDSAHDDNFTVPPLLTTQVKLAFDRSFKDKLKTEEAAKAYIRSVAEHGSLYLQHFSPKTKIFLNFEDKIDFIDETFEPKLVDLRRALAFKQPEAVPLIIFCAKDDTNDFMGVSPGLPGKACDEQKGVSLMKHRSKKSLAAMTFGHELGHIHGMRHDHRENASCHGTGLMSEVRPDLLPDHRPPVFSSCSITRFNKWFKNYGFTCMEDRIVNKDAKMKYLETTCTTLIASPGNLLQSGCQKPGQLKDGAWVCSADGEICYARCNLGNKIVQSNLKTSIECYHRFWTENPNSFSCEIDQQYAPPVCYKVSSSGEANAEHNTYMGDYFPTGNFSSNFPIFRNGNHFLYVTPIGYWMIGSKIGVDEGLIHYPHYSPTPSSPPRTGWSYALDGKWFKDNTLTVVSFTERRVPIAVVCYKVSSSGEANAEHTNYMGDYFPTGNSSSNFPIFKKGNHFLYVTPYGFWMIGPKIGVDEGIIHYPQDSPTPSSPPRTGWKYALDGKWVKDNALIVVAYPPF